MDTMRIDLLAQLYSAGSAFDATQPDRRNRRRNLEPESAAVLHALVSGLKPTSLLELGTSNGYSTIWLADALPMDAAFITVDNDAGRMAEATENLRATSLDRHVRQILGDGAQVLEAADSGEWAFIFLDAERSLYTAWWPELQRTLAPGGLVVVDNVLSHADQVAEFRALVDATEGYRSLVLSVGAGLLFIAKQGA